MAFGDVVQSNGGTGAASSSFSATLGSAITAGNLVVLMVTANNVPSGTNAGWTKSTGMSPVANAQGLLWWFIGTAGQAIPSVTFAGASTYAWRVVEYAGPFDASPYGTSAGAATNGTINNIATSSITPTASQDYLIVAGLGGQEGASSNWNIGSVTLGSFTNSFGNATQQFRQAVNEAHIACLASRVVTSASGSYTTTGTPSTSATSGSSCRVGMTIAFKRGTGVTHYTMPAVNGTLTASGQVARLARSRKMPAVNGTLTLAGPTVNLIYSGAGPKTMPAGIGFLGLSGQAAILRRTRVMPAGAGALALAGQTVTLRYAHKMPAGQGTLTLSGRTVTLRYGRKMPAARGTIALSGPVVNLIYSGAGSKTLPAGLGVLTAAGQPVTLRYARKIIAGPGVVWLSGPLVNLVYTEAAANHYVMTVETGHLALIGQPAGLVHSAKNHYVMAAGSSTLMMTGFPAPVRYGPALQQPGVFKFGRRVTIPNRW
jgi:hypothetical protein